MTGPLIVGAGMAGLIAGSMLRGQHAGIIEAKSSLPHNHAALLRFRSSVVGDATGIPFRPVQVMKAVYSPTNPVRDAIQYSRKVTGSPAIRSIVSANGAIETRWVAPADFIERLAAQNAGTIGYDQPFQNTGGRPVISTVPMPTLMEILAYPGREEIDFRSREGWVLSADLLDIDICATLYYPNPALAPYRASITGNRLIIEGIKVDMAFGTKNSQSAIGLIDAILEDFGLGAFDVSNVSMKDQPYAKILSIPEDVRKRFIMWASDRYDIYSLGRFATWRPGLMLDDIVNDVRVIHRMIETGDKSAPYNGRK